MLARTRRFIDFLNKENYNLFENVYSVDNTDVLQHNEIANGLTIQTAIFINEDLHTEVTYFIAECTDAVKREEIQLFLNQLNRDRKLKYFMNNEKIIASFTYWADDSSFNNNLLFTLYMIFLKILIEDKDKTVNKIMKIIWG